MKKLLLTSVLVLGSAATGWGEVHVNVNIGTAPYYGFAGPEVVYVERYVPYDYVPRVLYVARYARVRPAVVVDLYRGGWGWDRICTRYRVPRSSFYGTGYYGGGRYYGRGYDRNYYDRGSRYYGNSRYSNSFGRSRDWRRDDRGGKHGHGRHDRGHRHGRRGWRD